MWVCARVCVCERESTCGCACMCVCVSVFFCVCHCISGLWSNHCVNVHMYISQLTDFDCAALLDEWNLCDVFQGDPQGTIHYNPPEVMKI